MADALFERLDEARYLPLDWARGPWSPDALHGGPVGTLLAVAGEELLEDLFPARVTVELLRPVPLAPLTLTGRTLRPGRKVRLVSGELSTADGTVVASATFLGIRRAEITTPPDPAPQPVAPPPPDAVTPAPPADVSIAEELAFHNAGTEHRFAVGAFLEVGPATDWIRLAVPVVAGEVPTPLQRVMGAADFGNGISRLADFDQLLFINPDLTVHLHRLPVGEWVALDARSHLEPHGVGLAESRLWDEQGPIGRALQSLLLEAR
jgi:hypothetical protein